MEKMVVIYVSDCCGCESNVDYEVCSSCGEHCEIIKEEYSVWSLTLGVAAAETFSKIEEKD
jgi:rRNA maturation endonuclease Nob1